MGREDATDDSETVAQRKGRLREGASRDLCHPSSEEKEQECTMNNLQQVKGPPSVDSSAGAFAVGGVSDRSVPPLEGQEGETGTTKRRSEVDSIPAAEDEKANIVNENDPKECPASPLMASILDTISPMPELLSPPPTVPGAFRQFRGAREAEPLSRALVGVSAQFNANDDDDDDDLERGIRNCSVPTPSSDPAVLALPIAAELAEDHETQLMQEMEAKIRQEFEGRLHAVAVVADPAPMAGDPEAPFSKRQKLLYGVLSLLLLMAVVVGTVVGATSASPNSNGNMEKVAVPDNVTSTTVELKPVLQSVREHGAVICKQEMFDSQNAEGFTTELCKAFAAAIFNDSTKFEDSLGSFREHFGAIAEGKLDISTAHVSVNMRRDILESHSGVGFSFSTPYFYTGTGMAGVPNFLKCAEKRETFGEDCRDLKVCVVANTVTQEIIEAYLNITATLTVDIDSATFLKLASGDCNVIAGDGIMLKEQFARAAGYMGDFAVSNKFLSHEHLALITRQGDPQWAEFCDWVLRALVTAEALNITQDNAQDMGATDLFGPEYQNMFINVIAAVGNYGQIYDRMLGRLSPRPLYNQINTGATGLIASNPFGILLIEGPSSGVDSLGPIPNGTMEEVVSRGYLRCGVILVDAEGNPRSGLAEFNPSTQAWSGIDVDYCRGLAASVLAGRVDDVVFVNLSDPEVRFRSLANKTVDVLAGERFSMITDVREPTTGQGYSFSTPYFYYNATANADGGAIALLTRQDDDQWSDVVNWITQFTFYAEEKGIVQATASKMPVIQLFGDQYIQMIRDTIQAIGNYGEIYQRNLEALIPRGGRNLLNTENTPQFYPIVPFPTTQR